jgi:5,10-methylene-tetrahydrofolate dehydrogenase/methenyl tetrahydrofolate cyclohydrolase
MAMTVLDGNLVSKQIKEEIRKEIAGYAVKPKLVVILVGENPAS